MAKAVKKTNESYSAGDQVKVKSSGKNGKVTSVDTNNHKFSVLMDDGETGEFSEDALEPIDAQIEDAIDANKDEAAKQQVEAVQEEETQAVAQTVEQPQFVPAKVTIDIGPYKAGDTVMIDATGFTSSGDEDTVIVKDPKDPGVPGIQKKYIKVDDVKADAGNGPVEEVLKNLDSAETLMANLSNMDKTSKEALLLKLQSIVNKIEKQS